MAHAIELVPECQILKQNPVLTFTEGKYAYRIERKGDQSIYSISDGQESRSYPVGWAFGQGLAGQTYVFQNDGTYYQTRVSYYGAINGLDLTLGAENIKPTNMEEAQGIQMAPQEAVQCFACHATNSIEAKKLVTDKLIAGLQCERCHGPTENHLQGIKQGDPKLAAMPKLSSFSTEQTSAFCGQCHRTWEEIASSGKLGITNVRFQPYRLTNSKCYDTEDSRISCVACHNPHQEVDTNAAHYDSKCQACHGGGKATAVACKVATSNCVTCHMPKVEIPRSHHKFFDHEIRIVKANEYPN
jgi:DnaJ-class molecular chaperone